MLPRGLREQPYGLEVDVQDLLVLIARAQQRGARRVQCERTTRQKRNAHAGTDAKRKGVGREKVKFRKEGIIASEHRAGKQQSREVWPEKPPTDDRIVRTSISEEKADQGGSAQREHERESVIAPNEWERVDE